MKTLILTILLAAGLSAQANQDSDSTSAAEFSKEETETAPRGLLPFIGLGGGYTGYDNDEGALAEGTPFTLKLLGSWYLESPWVIDLGYGVNYQQFSDAPEDQDDAIADGALEFATRYNFDSRWQFGIVANQMFNQGVNYSADQADAQFVGLQLLKEFNMTPSWLARFGVRAETLTNNSTDGMINMYLVDLQFGWNPGAYKPSVKSTASTQTVEGEVADQRIEPARPVAAVETSSALNSVNMAMIAGAGSAIQFRSSQYALSGADQRKISQVAKVLNENPDLVERVEIHGYADASGSDETNQRISQARADSVKSILERNGVSNVEAVGKGATDTTGIKSQDRRAELIFVGVKDEEALRRALSTIQ